MGYTHYWTIKDELNREKFIEWAEGVKVIVETAIEAGIPLGNGLGDDKPELSDSLVVFNGVGDGSHESFALSIDGDGFNFCKTARKPYDAVVTASLIHAKKIFGPAIEVSSDGGWDEWEGGQLLYETVFDVQPKESEVFA